MSSPDDYYIHTMYIQMIQTMRILIMMLILK